MAERMIRVEADDGSSRGRFTVDMSETELAQMVLRSALAGAMASSEIEGEEVTDEERDSLFVIPFEFPRALLR